MKEFLIGKNDAGQRLDRFVAKAAPLLPSSLAQKYIRIKRIKVGGKGSKRDCILRLGDVVQMYVNDEFLPAAGPLPPAPNPSGTIPAIEIVYEDGNILLVNKKAGTLCHSAGTGVSAGVSSHKGVSAGTGISAGSDTASGTANTLVAQIQSYLLQKGEWAPETEHSFSPALCNRIDRNTSGIVIAAKNAEALRIINEKIKLREIDKCYLAAVHGLPAPPSGRLEGYLEKDTVKNLSFFSADPLPRSKRVSTDYKTLAARGSLALLECRLVTGRSHQIRAQFSAIGHPLLGDIKYGGKEINKPYAERCQALCAYKLIFAFKSDSGILEYLRGKSFELNDVPFVKKYFYALQIS